MFKSLKGLFGKEKAIITPPRKKKTIYAPNTKIAYRPNLVKTLKGEHKELVRLYTVILSSAENGDVKKVKSELLTFKAKFTGHIIKENINFYVYVENSVNDPATLELIREMKLEMDSIAKVVRDFIKEYTHQHSVIDEKFIASLKGIGVALTTRIDSEEEFLYPTYQSVMS